AALLGVGLISLGWSQAPLDAAAGYWLSWASDVATIWFLLREGDPETKAAAVMKGFVWGSCIVAAIAWASPAAQDLRLGDLIFLHPNLLGFLFSIATFMAIHLAHETTLWKSSIFAFLIALIFYLVRDSTLSRKVKIRIGIVAALIVVSLSGLLEA